MRNNLLKKIFIGLTDHRKVAMFCLVALLLGAAPIRSYADDICEDAWAECPPPYDADWACCVYGVCGDICWLYADNACHCGVEYDWVQDECEGDFCSSFEAVDDCFDICDFDFSAAAACGYADDWVINCADCAWICATDADLACDIPDEDCDGDGASNGIECDWGSDPCDASDVPPCDWLCAEDLACDVPDWDCDEDGASNGIECDWGSDPCDASDVPPCDWLCAEDRVCDVPDWDCDEDGAPNGIECDYGSDACDGTDFPPCDWLCAEDRVCDVPDWDCDEDGASNGIECEYGSDACDGTDFPPCDWLCAEGYECEVEDWDCDEDGASNGIECEYGSDACDGTDFPPCDWLCAEGYECEVEDWDCDEDGASNGIECEYGSDACDGTDFPPCDWLCAEGYECEVDDWDCDEDGVSNGIECDYGSDPCDGTDLPPCDWLCAEDYACDVPDEDCDEDGVSNGIECDYGSDPCDATDLPPCDWLCAEDYACDVPDEDCDEDGVSNGIECDYGSDPCDALDIPGCDWICANDPDLACDIPDEDCDGDSVSNGDECDWGSDPCDPDDMPEEITIGVEDQAGNDESEDPVNTVTGAFTMSETDIVLPGRYPITIGRTYNSKNPTSTLLGGYWRFSHNPYLYVDEVGEGLILAADPSGRVMLYSNDTVPGSLSRGDRPAGGSPGTPLENRRKGYIYIPQPPKRQFTLSDPNTYYAYPEYNPGIVNFTRKGIGAKHSPFSQRIVYDPATDSYTLTTGAQESRRFERNQLNPNKGPYHLTRIENAKGDWLSISYQSNPTQPGYGLIAGLENSSGNSVTITYNGQNRISSVVGNDGRSVSYGYDGSGNLISFSNPEGAVTGYTYDQHRITKVEKPDNRVLENIYSEVEPGDFRIVQQKSTVGTNPTPITYNTLSYDLENRTTTITDALGRATTYYYDTWARVIKIQGADSQSKEFHYDEKGNLVEQVDRRGVYTTMEYDDRGNILVQRKAAGTPEVEVTTFTYDPVSNKVASVTDCLGGKVVNEYDAAGNLISKKRFYRNGTLYDETHYVLDEEYGEPLQEIVAYGTEDQASTTYTYNSLGKVATKMNAENETVTNTYDSRGNLLSMTNGEGEMTSYTYDLLNRKKSMANALGETTRWEYDANGNKQKETDPLGRETLYTYDYANRLIMITLPLPSHDAIHYGYDYAGNKTKMIDALGRETVYEYDSLNRLTHVAGPACCGQAGAWATYSYDANGNRTLVETPSGQTHFSYDALNRLTSVTDAYDHAKTIEYDCLGQKTNETDRNGNYVAYEYDDFGRVTRIEYRDSEDTLLSYKAFAYDRRNNIISQTDGRGHATTLAYDGDNRLIGSSDPYGHTTVSTYDEAGRLKERTDANEHRDFLMTYDGAGRVISIEDALGKTVEYEYDAAGNKILQRDQEGNETTYEYDALNRLTRTTDALGHETVNEYDALHLIRKIDAAGNITRYEYNALNRISREIDPLWNVTRYEYDQSGNRTKITDPLGHEISFGYNSLNRLIGKTDQLGHVTTFDYDAEGNQILKTDPNQNEITMTYDGINRLVSRTDTGTSYEYDGNNNVTGMTDPTGATTYTYDYNNRLTSIASPQGTINYTYDNAGNRSTMTYPGGRTLTYNYRDDDRLESIEDSGGGTISYGYDNGNDLTLVQYPNGTKKEIDYDELHQMVTLANEKNDDTVIRAYGFEYDPLGNKTHIAESDNTGPVMGRNYTYDALSRLTSEEINSQTTTYTYDPLGNRLSKISGDSITGYEYNGLNQLTKMGSATPELSETITVTGTVTDAQSVTVNGLNAPIANGEYSKEIELAGGWNTINVIATSAAGKQAHRSVDVFLAGDSTNFIYDNNGNMTHKTDTTGTINYGYDLADRLTSITYPDTRPATSYAYNGRNKKVSQTMAGDVTKYLWDGDQIIRELDGSGQTRATLVHGLGLGADIGSIVKAERSGQNQFFHFDWRGSVTSLTNQTAQTIQTYQYDAFGNVTDSTGSAVNPYQFSSKHFDPNSGLSYFGRRHYSAQLGRFIKQDPRGYVEGLNTYAYVKNNPVNILDPLGLDPGDRFPTFEDAASDAVDYIYHKSIENCLEYGGYIYQNDDGTYSYTEVEGEEDEVKLGDRPDATVGDYHSHGCDDDCPGCYENFSVSTESEPGDIPSDIPGILVTPGGLMKMYDPETDEVYVVGEAD